MTTPSNPSAPCVPLGAIFYDMPSEDGYAVYDALTRPRATVQRRHADELGIPFQSVSCSKCYLRALSRQESWDAGGRDYWHDEQLMRYCIGYYFAHSDAARHHGEGYYFDHIILPDGSNEPVPAALIKWLEPPEQPPYGWTPREDAYGDEIVEWVDYHHPEAIPVFVCEEV